LSMKHEEIENLSVSTVHSATTENFPLHSSLKSPNSLSSSSDPGKKVRFELTEGVDSVDKHLSGSSLESENSLDQTRYKQLQLKLNSHRNEQLDSDRQHENPPTTASAALSSNSKTTAAVTTATSSSSTTTVRTQIQTTSRSVEDLDTTMLSYQEIQQIFREKRRELDVQLAHLEDAGYQHMEMSEGSLSTSRSETSTLRTSKAEGSLSTSKGSVSSGYVASKGPDLQNKYLSSCSNSSSNSLTNVTSVQSSSSTSTDSRNHSVGSRFTLSDVDSDFPKLLKQVTQSTPHKNQGLAMTFERDQRLKIRQFSGPPPDDDVSDFSEIQEMRELTKMRELKGRRTRELAKMREFKEMRELSSFFSDAGTDSESGSKISRIDLSSDTSNIH